MSIPTEPGWYWWTHKWTLQTRVDYYNPRASEGMKLRFKFAEWGPRVPSPDALTALRELRDFGWETQNDEEVYRRCRYCDGETGRNGTQKHAPDCPWLRAQEKPHADAD